LIEVAFWVIAWLSAGALVYYCGAASGEGMHDDTVGEFLLVLVFGPPFLPLILLGWLAQLKMPKRKRPAPKERPRWRQEAEREVDSWLKQ